MFINKNNINLSNYHITVPSSFFSISSPKLNVSELISSNVIISFCSDDASCSFFFGFAFRFLTGLILVDGTGYMSTGTIIGW